MNRKKATHLGLVLFLTFSGIPSVSAGLLFEDDLYHNINSEGLILDANNNAGTTPINLQLGNDGSDANLQYDPTTQDITVSTPGGDISFSDENLTTTGALLFQSATEFHIREVADEAAAQCTTLDELVVDTNENAIYICTGVGNPGAWTTVASGGDADTLDTLDSTQFLRSDTSDQYTNGTLTFNLGTILDVNGDADFSGATSFNMFQGIVNPLNCLEGQMFYNTVDNLLYICTAADTWTSQASGNQDFEAVYAADADNVLTALVGFAIDAVGAIGIDSDLGVTIGGAGVDITSDTLSDITITSADDIILDDAQLTGTVQLSDSDTDWDATLAGDGIVDNINSFTSTANGEGASNVGLEDSSNWFTGAEIEAALNELEALLGSATSSTFNFTEGNLLADNDPVYTALNKLDLKWGDLATTANGEGASLVGIEDAGANFVSTDVEGALAELASSAGANTETLLFYPEYPNTTVYPDGSNNSGTLESLYDSTEETGYYDWTSANVTTQDIDLRFTFPLPADFNATDDFTYRYRTGTIIEADNDVEVRLYNLTDGAECANDLTNVSAALWATGTINAASINTGCTGGTALDSGDVVEVQIKLLDNSGALDYANVGRVHWNYSK